MDIKTYRAATMHEALALVRTDLGPDAAVLHTREVRQRGLWAMLSGGREFEVTASTEVHVASRLPSMEPPPRREEPIVSARRFDPTARDSASLNLTDAASLGVASGEVDAVKGQLSELQAMVQKLCRHGHHDRGHRDLPDSLFRLYTDLIEADLNEEIARDLVERVQCEASGSELDEPILLKARVARILESEIRTAGPLPIVPGKTRRAALVGPTGVGKTTTIAKLAANFRLKEKRSVGLITVDTYRIAAVEQLRTYADIIDLPMQVVSTPRQMRDAVRRLDGLDLVLIDTAGRSGRDEIKIQELKAFMTEAGAHDVLLVLSAVTGARALERTATQFAAAGTTGLIVTKLDEATGLGNLLPLLRRGGLPMGYWTNGQNVPDDIETADAGNMTRLILEMDHVLDTSSR